MVGLVGRKICASVIVVVDILTVGASDYEQKTCKSMFVDFTSISFPCCRVLLLRFLWYWTWLYMPDFCCVFSDGAVAGELPRARHIQDGLARPLVGIGI